MKIKKKTWTVCNRRATEPEGPETLAFVQRKQDKGNEISVSHHTLNLPKINTKDIIFKYETLKSYTFCQFATP